MKKDFEYFKNWAINHLKKQTKKDADVCKSFFYAEKEINKAFGVGTIRTWKGKKYIKGADKKWRPYYESNSRGKKMAVAAIIRQINNLQDGDLKGLYNIIKNNKSRFVNENGKPENEVIALYKMIKEKGSVGSGKFKNENKETRLSLLREDFHKEMKKYVGKEFKNSNFEDDIKANFSGKSITKIESDKAIEKTVANGFTKEQHFEVAKQIKELFEKADKGFYHEDRKSTNEKTGLKRIVRLYADVKLKDNTKAVAYITLRESFENGTKIYTIELMDIKKASENTDAVLDGLTIDNKRNGFLKKKSVHNSSITEYGEKSRDNFTEELSNLLKEKAVDMPKEIEFTKENYNKLFKNGIDSPIEKVKVGENQFEKLKAKNRKDLLATMYETIKKPNVIGKTENGEKLYIKTFKKDNKTKNIVSVIIDKGKLHISISTHEERFNQIAKKIARILYKNSSNDEVKTSYDGTVQKESVAENTPEKTRAKGQQLSNDTSLSHNSSIPQSDKKSSVDLEKQRNKLYRKMKAIDKKIEKLRVTLGNYNYISEMCRVINSYARSGRDDEDAKSNTEKQLCDYGKVINGRGTTKLVKEKFYDFLRELGAYEDGSKRGDGAKSYRLGWSIKQDEILSTCISFREETLREGKDFEKEYFELKKEYEKIENELFPRNKSINKSFSSQVNYFKKKLEERLA